jgi:hypothetical protein
MSVEINGLTGLTFNNGSTQDVGGVGTGSQTWTNVTSSRAQGTTYTNTTGKPISVVIVVPLNGSTLTLFVNGLAIQSMGNTSIGNGTVTAIVPNGSTYSLTAVSSIASWFELR